MPSPFPGMDPFLEEHWGDVHTSLTVYARNQLNEALPEGVVARIEEFEHQGCRYSTRSSSTFSDIRSQDVTILEASLREVGGDSVGLAISRAAKSETFSRRWKLSVMSVASWLAWVVDNSAIVSSMAALNSANAG